MQKIDQMILMNFFQGLVDLLEPFFLPAIDELLADVESGRTWTLNHVPEAISKLIANLEDLAILIPKSFFFVSCILKPCIGNYFFSSLSLTTIFSHLKKGMQPQTSVITE